MANYLYNGVELPELPEWDETVYPYAYILYGFAGIGPAIMSSEPVYHDYDSALVPPRDHIYMPNGAECLKVPYTGSSWGEFISFTADTLQMDLIKWTNNDIIRSDGTLYLAASEPIPITAPVLDPLSLWLGWKAGNWVARQRGKKAEEEKTPIAYLYNGVRLPDINAVWTDKETYPYAAVVPLIQDCYALCIAGDIPTTGHNDTFGSTLVLEVGTEAKTYILATTQEVANILGISETNVWTWDEDFTAKEGEYLCTIDQVTWASHDVLNEDGTLYLAASEPVPVYE